MKTYLEFKLITKPWVIMNIKPCTMSTGDDENNTITIEQRTRWYAAKVSKTVKYFDTNYTPISIENGVGEYLIFDNENIFLLKDPPTGNFKTERPGDEELWREAIDANNKRMPSIQIVDTF